MHYLLGRGRVEPECIVNGPFTIVNASSRNRNFKVICGEEPGLFLKQISKWEPMAISTLEREAACYRLAQSNPEYGPLARLMPKFHDFDPAQYVLTLELLRASESVSVRHRRTGIFPQEIGRKIGEALGTYHRTASGLIGTTSQSATFPRLAPWILTLHTAPEGTVPGISSANAQLVNILRQYPSFSTRLGEIHQGWRHDGLIHGDIKWDNCVLCAGSNGDGEEDFRIVDWEMADVGDVAWDVGGVLQAYISAWILSIPPAAGGVAVPIDRAMYKLETMQPALHEFWTAYARERGFSNSAAAEMLLRSVRYGAARMIQTGFEHLQFSQQMSPNIVMLLQVSLNVLEHPQESIRDLLAIAA